jgi:hypothetical protein
VKKIDSPVAGKARPDHFLPLHPCLSLVERPVSGANPSRGCNCGKVKCDCPGCPPVGSPGHGTSRGWERQMLSLAPYRTEHQNSSLSGPPPHSILFDPIPSLETSSQVRGYRLPVQAQYHAPCRHMTYDCRSDAHPVRFL